MPRAGLKLVAKIQPNVEIWANIGELRKQVKRFSKTGVRRASFRAANKSANKAKTFTGRLLAKKYNTKISAFKPYLRVSPRASLNKQDVAIYGSNKARMPIYKHAKGAKKQTARGVRFNSGGGSRVHPHTFIAKMQSGHVGIYVRVHKKGGRRPTRISPTTGRGFKTHLGIREMTYPYVAHMITNDAVAQQIFNFYTNDYPTQLHAQLNFELSKSKGR